MYNYKLLYTHKLFNVEIAVRLYFVLSVQHQHTDQSLDNMALMLLNTSVANTWDVTSFRHTGATANYKKTSDLKYINIKKKN